MAIKYRGQTLGQDGFSPTINVSNIDGGHRVSITDITGTQTFDVEDGTNIEFDDTMTTGEDGTIGVANPNRGIMTQAEYDALSEEEKTKGTYFISDGQNGSVSGSDSASEVYSEEETLIGTWIDGKPLYRRVYTGTMPSTSSNWTKIANEISDLDTMTHLYGICGISESGIFAIPYSGTSAIQITYNISGMTGLLLYSQNPQIAGQPYYVIVEYTKTTD